MGKLMIGILVVAGCGRYGFDSPDAATPDDAPVPGDAPPPNVTLLPCGQPVRFAIGAEELAVLASVPTPTGFALATVDQAGNLAGWSYEWHDDALLATAQGVPLDSETRDVVGAAAHDGDLVVAAVYGAPAPLGTRLYPLGPGFAPRGAPIVRSEIGGARPVARSGVSSELAFVTVDPVTFQVEARRLTALGEPVGNPVIVVVPAEEASTVSIAPAGTGYLVNWTARDPTPNQNRIALLDKDLRIVAGPYTTSVNVYNAIRGHAVWARDSDRYLIAWYEKNVTNGDDVWFQIRDAALGVVTPPTLLAPNAVSPEIASDGKDFWLTYVDIAGPRDQLAAARITPTGDVMPRPVPTAGGVPGAWALLTRAGQSVLVWAERDAAGPDLYFDPMCP